MKTKWILLPLLSTFGLGWTESVSADPIPWEYNWSRSPTKINADMPGTGWIELTDEPRRFAFDDSNIVATNLRVYSTASPLDPDVFTNKSYTLSLFLLDVHSKKSGLLHFTGVLNGTASDGGADIENNFTGLTTQSIILGNSRYTATMRSYTPPGPPGSLLVGAIGARAIVTVETVPEPATLFLAGMGLGLFGLRRLRRLRN